MKKPYIDEYDKTHMLRDKVSESLVTFIFDLMKKGNYDAVCRILDESGFVNFYEQMVDAKISSLTLIEESKKDPNFLSREIAELNDDKLYPLVLSAYIDEDTLIINFKNDAKLKNHHQEIIPISFMYDLPKTLEVENRNRYGKCHVNSLIFSYLLDQRCTIVTGIIYGMTQRAEYLHSWVETKEKDGEFVYDLTMNARMSKELYYYLRKARPVKKINQKYIKEHFDEILEIINNDESINIKEFMLDPDTFLAKYGKAKS